MIRRHTHFWLNSGQIDARLISQHSDFNDEIKKTKTKTKTKTNKTTTKTSDINKTTTKTSDINKTND